MINGDIQNNFKIKLSSLCDYMDRIGRYSTKPYSKYRRNIEIVTQAGWKKRATHAVLEIDVTDSRKLMKKFKEKSKEKISTTGWIVKCVAQTMSENKGLNAYKHGKRKIYIFEDVDIAIPVEKKYMGESKPMAFIIRKANEKSLIEISNEIRDAQTQKVDESTYILGKKITRFEQFAINAPAFLQKLMFWIANKNAILKKKYMGTTGVTAIGMLGKFPGWVVPLGGTASTLFVVGGISKKPGVVNDKIEIREYLHLTMTTDHDIVDGGPLVHFVERLCELLENGYALSEK